MEIEGYDGIICTLSLAKNLHDIGRFDIVKQQFFDELSWDSFVTNVYGVIQSIFSGFYSDYEDCDEVEYMIFTDDYISRYYEIAWEYGRSHNVPHNENPFVREAANEANRWLSFCYSVDWKLLGYTKTRKTAKQSKLIVRAGICCECDVQGNLARGLVELYQWFADKCTEFDKRMEVIAA